MWAILQNFQLGNENSPTKYFAGQVVPDEEFTLEMREAKLLPNGWIAFEQGAPSEAMELKPYFAKGPYNDPV